MFFRKPTQEERLGCLCGILGILVGPSVFIWLNPPPKGLVCGLPILAAVLIGSILGGVVGSVFGMAISHLVPGRKREKPVDQSPNQVC